MCLVMLLFKLDQGANMYNALFNYLYRYINTLISFLYQLILSQHTTLSILLCAS